MHTPQQRSSSNRTRRGKRSRRGRSPSPRPGCINAAAPAAASAPAPQQQPSRPHTGNGSNSGADSVRRRTPTPPTTRTGRASPMSTSARSVGGGIGNGIGTHTTGPAAVGLGGRGGTPGSFVPPHLRSAGTVAGSSGGRRGLVRRTHSPKTVVSDRHMCIFFPAWLFFALDRLCVWRICSLRGLCVFRYFLRRRAEQQDAEVDLDPDSCPTRSKHVIMFMLENFYYTQLFKFTGGEEKAGTRRTGTGRNSYICLTLPVNLPVIYLDE